MGFNSSPQDLQKSALSSWVSSAHDWHDWVLDEDLDNSKKRSIVLGEIGVTLAEINSIYERDLGVTFKKIFMEIIKKKNKKKWNSRHKDLQYFKRGRYIEFNLLYDRGTKFGLETGGNLDAIFMSLPPTAKWK